jgi:hypothetical protein
MSVLLLSMKWGASLVYTPPHSRERPNAGPSLELRTSRLLSSDILSTGAEQSCTRSSLSRALSNCLLPKVMVTVTATQLVTQLSAAPPRLGEPDKESQTGRGVPPQA